MAGTWTMLDTKDSAQRSGFYLNFVADTVAGVQAGANGVVAIPVTAPWGPEATIVEIGSPADLTAKFSDKDEGTAHFQITNALKNAKTVMAYRVAVNSAKASINLVDGTSTNLITVTALYSGTFGNDLSVTVATNLADNTKKDFKVYNGSILLEVFTFDGTAADLVAKVTNSAYVTVSKLADGTLANVSNSALAGGNSGLSVTNNEYSNALTAFEGRAYEWNTMGFPVTDNTFALQQTAIDYIKRLRSEGYYVNLVLGHWQNADFANAKTKAVSINHEGVIYHYAGAVVAGVTKTPADMIGLIAGMVAGAGPDESITHAVIDGIDSLAETLTNTDIRDANKAGLVVGFYDGANNRIEKGINTLTSYSATQNEGYSKIKVMAVMDAIGSSVVNSANKNYVGNVLNDDEGQKALIGAIKDAFDIFVQGRLIKKGYTVQLDPNNPSVGDQVFISMAATPIDAMEEIYGEIRVGR